MTSVSVLLYELDKDEARNLPVGFPILEYDTLYSSLRVISAKENPIRDEKRFVYLLYKEPPTGFMGNKGKKRSALAEAVRGGE